MITGPLQKPLGSKPYRIHLPQPHHQGLGQSPAKFNLKNFAIPAAKYTEMQVYMDAVAKAQNKKLVIHRKT
jgi:hypothetical protein